MGGMRGAVLMQTSGFGTTLNVLASLVVPDSTIVVCGRAGARWKLLGLRVAVKAKLEEKIGRDARTLSVRRPCTDEIVPTGLAFAASFQRRRPHVVAKATGKGLVCGKARIETL
jgi:hypothetical protein